MIVGLGLGLGFSAALAAIVGRGCSVRRVELSTSRRIGREPAGTTRLQRPTSPTLPREADGHFASLATVRCHEEPSSTGRGRRTAFSLQRQVSATDEVGHSVLVAYMKVL